MNGVNEGNSRINTGAHKKEVKTSAKSRINKVVVAIRNGRGVNSGDKEAHRTKAAETSEGLDPKQRVRLYQRRRQGWDGCPRRPRCG